MQLTLPKDFFFKEADFEMLFKTGRKRFGQFFILYFHRADIFEDGVPRLGFSVAKKAVGNSVRRNMVKRLIRENYRVRQHALSKYRVLISAKKDLKKQFKKGLIQRENLQEDLCRLLENLAQN